MTRRFPLANALVCIGAALYCMTARADGPATMPAATQPAPAVSLSAEPAEGMFIDDARDAENKLALAQQMERQKDWDKGAAGYQELLEKYGSQAFPSRVDDDGQVIQYINFGDYLQRCIAGWPSAGIQKYRDKFEPAAKAMLASAGDDLALLDRVCSLYFCADSGKQAALRMMDAEMEAGDFAAAALIGDRLLSAYPDLQEDRPMVLYRTALAYRYSGDAKKAAELCQALQQQFAAARGTVRGNEVVLADSLAQELAAMPKGWQPPDLGPPRGGILSPGRLGDSTAFPDQRLYRIAVDSPAWKSIQLPPVTLPISPKDTDSPVRAIGILPVADHGELFFQDGHHLFAIDLATGTPLSGWLKTYPKGVYTLAGVTESSRRHQLSITLTDSRVLAIMAHPDQQTQDAHRMNGGGGIPGDYAGEPRLVCLDRASGAELWTAVLSELPESAKSARALQMIGSPLVVGREVLVTARGRNGLRDLEMVYVLAFDLDSGKFRWCTFVAAHSPLLMGTFDFRSISAQQAEVATHLTYADGMVYVQSNLGALAALDPLSGRIDWLDIFPIGRTPPKGANQLWAFHLPRPVDHPPWSFNPVVINSGLIFTMPSEGEALNVCDARTGREINRIDLAKIVKAAPDPGSKAWMRGEESSTFDTLIGIRGDTLVLASQRTLYCLNWKNYNPAAPDPLAGAITRWKTLMPSVIRGRAFMSDREILVPCQDHLYRLNPDTGKITDTFAWNAPDEPGNVLATVDEVVIAGADTVTVYRGHR